MITLKFRSIGLALIATLISAQASATFITLSAQSFALGTDVSQALPGATLSGFGGNQGDRPTFSPITVEESDGRHVLASSQSGFYGADEVFIQIATSPSGYMLRDMHLLRVDFDTPTNYVELRGSQRTNGTGLFAFNSAGQLVDKCSVFDRLGDENTAIGQHGCWTYFGLTQPDVRGDEIGASILRPTADISFIITGTYFVGSGVTDITQFSYNSAESVPEPTTLGLLGLGLLGVTIAKRRKQRKVIQQA